MTRIMSWNVNGLRAIVDKKVAFGVGFHDFISKFDIVCLSETRMTTTRTTSQGLATRSIEVLQELDSMFKHSFHTHAFTNGYSGVTVLSKVEATRLRVPASLQTEGRVVAIDTKAFVFIAVYQPNSGVGLKRLLFRQLWDRQFRRYVRKFTLAGRSVVIGGDFNVAIEDADVHESARHDNNAGFTIIERNGVDRLLADAELVDVWRSLHPKTIGYTYFDYRTRARSRNSGWRLDYFMVSKRLLSRVRSCRHLPSIEGSDHIPIVMTLV